MSKYKIEANENVYIRSLDENLRGGDKLNIDSPSDTVLNELERCQNIGLLRYVELVEKRVDTYPEEDEEQKDEEETGVTNLDDFEGTLDEFIEENENYYCEMCGRTHYTDSSIGLEHLEELINK